MDITYPVVELARLERRSTSFTAILEREGKANRETMGSFLLLVLMEVTILST